MTKDDSDKPPPRRIDLAAKARFLEMLRAGASRKDAAAGSGFSWRAFYQVRNRDPIFLFGWLAALELSAVDERTLGAPPGGWPSGRPAGRSRRGTGGCFS